MRLLYLFIAISFSFEGLAYEISAFNLATRGYQGAYAEELMSDGYQLGGYARFCANVHQDLNDVAETLFKAANSEGKIAKSTLKEDYMQDLKYQVRLSCLRQ